MINNFNYFKNLKEFYKFAFENFKFVSEQQKNIMNVFLDSQPEAYRENIRKVYDEWNKNAEKALQDYRDMVFKGLEYLETMYDNAVNKTVKK